MRFQLPNRALRPVSSHVVTKAEFQPLIVRWVVANPTQTAFSVMATIEWEDIPLNELVLLSKASLTVIPGAQGTVQVHWALNYQMTNQGNLTTRVLATRFHTQDLSKWAEIARHRFTVELPVFV